MILRFGLMDGKTRSLEDVGKELNITCERARQLEAKALRIMRSPSRLCKLPPLFGFIPPRPSIKLEAYYVDDDGRRIAPPPETSIDVLGLNIRAYNCLKRFANVNTVGDVLDYPTEDWLKIKNLGRKAALEVQDKMRAVGYSDFSVGILS